MSEPTSPDTSLEDFYTAKYAAKGHGKTLSIEPNSDEVICPQCACQFRAIPVNIQKFLLSSGFTPPFLEIPKVRNTPTDQEYFAKSFGEQRETSGNSWVGVPDVPNVFTHRLGTLGNPYCEGDTSIPTPLEFPPRLLTMTDQQCVQQLIDLAHFLNRKWWVDLQTGEPIERNTGELLMLVTSELGEALEADSKNLMDDKLPHRPGLEVEIADAIIRLLDMAGGKKLDVAGALVEKLVFNSRREDHTREHRLSEHGKKY